MSCVRVDEEVSAEMGTSEGMGYATGNMINNTQWQVGIPLCGSCVREGQVSTGILRLH